MRWPLVSAQDEFVQATPENAAELGYIWVSKPTPKTKAKQLWALPFQGSRFYHVSAVELMLRSGRATYADLGPGLRASAHLSPEVFRAPLDQIEEALPGSQSTCVSSQQIAGWARCSVARLAGGSSQAAGTWRCPSPGAC